MRVVDTVTSLMSLVGECAASKKNFRLYRQSLYAYCTLNAMSNEQRAISNESSVLHRHMRKSRTFVGYRLLLITSNKQCNKCYWSKTFHHLFTSMALSRKHKPNCFFSLHLSFYLLLLYLLRPFSNDRF